MRTPLSSSRALLAAIAALGGFLGSSFAQSVTTTPVGAVTVTAAAGTGTSRVLTPISFPLIEAKVAAGATIGRISSVTVNTITVDNAGWTAGQLSAPAEPTLIQITSGAASGQIFLVSTSVANTATTITLDAEDAALVNLTSLGLVTGASGDTFRLLECDTLASLLDGTVVRKSAASSATDSDLVQVLVSGSFASYFMDSAGNWRRVALGSPISNNVPVRPDAIVLYNRLDAQPASVTLVGTVPDIDRQVRIKSSGTTVVSSYWPAETTLAGMSLQTTPGWVTAASSTTADIVSIFSNGSWGQYFHNGTNWRRVALGSPISDTLVIPVGSAVVVSKRGTATGSTAYVKSRPYSL